MATEPCFIDSNVPMYAVGADHVLKAPCVALLRAIAQGEILAVTSVEVLQEILHRFTAQGQREHAVDVVRSFMEVVPDILPVTSADITAALTLHLAHPTLQTRDVMHLATMSRHGIQTIITADRHFDVVEGLRRVDPAGWNALRPNAVSSE
jgi:predicted nucleic acid-binding protein